MTDGITKGTFWRRQNWWKISFFVLLVVFEFTRELAVLQSDREPQFNVTAQVARVGNFTFASGLWTRIDGGTPLVPSLTRIDCIEQTGQCQVITATFFGGSLNSLENESFKAKFTADSVSYVNDAALCARYSVRIDLKLGKLFALKERKPQSNPKIKLCQNEEPRMELTLGDGNQVNSRPFGDHFVPFFRLIRWILV